MKEIWRVFKELNVNNSREINRREFLDVYPKLGAKFSDKVNASEIFDAFDDNSDGLISYH